MSKLIIVAISAILLCGCSPDDTYYDQVEKAKDVNDSSNTHYASNEKPKRFRVERLSIFHDSLAYDGKRGVYLITENKTGKEFVGISGVGISTLGSHSDGKISYGDER